MAVSSPASVETLAPWVPFVDSGTLLVAVRLAGAPQSGVAQPSSSVVTVPLSIAFFKGSSEMSISSSEPVETMALRVACVAPGALCVSASSAGSSKGTVWAAASMAKVPVATR